MKATFSSPRQIDFKPIDNNETILLEHMKDIANNQLSFKKDEKYGDISLIIDEPKNVVEVDNLAGKIIHMNFPESFRDLVDTHEIMLMKDGSKIECLVLTEEVPEEPTVPTIPDSDIYCDAEKTTKHTYTKVKLFDDEQHDYKLMCSNCNHEILHVKGEPDLVDPTIDIEVNVPENPEVNTNGTCTVPELTENNEKYQSVVPEGYYVDPTAPCGFRKCRVGHIHGATYMHPDCCICNDHLESLMKRTIVIRLISDTLGEVVLFSLVGIDDVRINMKLFKVDTTTDMTVLDINKNSPFYDCFKI